MKTNIAMPGLLLHKEFVMDLPSEDFQSVICCAATGIIKCEFCDRVHFAPYTDLDVDRDEIRELIEKSKTDPRHYVLNPDDAIAWGHLDNRQFVYGCPCRAAARYERFILEHKEMIISYLRAIAKRMKAEHEKLQQDLDSIGA